MFNSSNASPSQLDPSQLDPFDQAMLDYFNGDIEAEIRVHYSGGNLQTIPVEYFFRGSEDLPPEEQMALDLCRGSVLDIGAGSGCHSLILQKKGLSIYALDNSKTAIEIMTLQGIKNIIQADIFTYSEGSFDTLLLLMNTIGLVQTLAGLEEFLKSIHRLVNPGGQLLLDSVDLDTVDLDPDQDEETLEKLSESYSGEITYIVEYLGQQGSKVPWLYVDPDTLIRIASQTQWHCQIIYQDDEGSYLAKLTALSI